MQEHFITLLHSRIMHTCILCSLLTILIFFPMFFVSFLAWVRMNFALLCSLNMLRRRIHTYVLKRWVWILWNPINTPCTSTSVPQKSDCILTEWPYYYIKCMEKWRLRKNSSPRWDLNPRPSTHDPPWLDHGGSWVQIPSGTRIFSESSFLHTFNIIVVVGHIIKGVLWIRLRLTGLISSGENDVAVMTLDGWLLTGWS